MRVVLLGGSGMVGRLLGTHLADRHDLVVVDPTPPESPAVRHHPADLTAEGALDILAGADAVVHLAAVVPRSDETADPARIAAAYAVNVGSVHVALLAARRHGLRSFVHVGTMSVHAAYGRRPVDPTAPPDATEPYGLSKRLAENVCRALSEGHPRPSVCSLRLAYPTPDDDWPLWRRPDTGALARPSLADGTPVAALSGRDLASAVEAALRYRGGYRAFTIIGDRRTIDRDDDTAAVLGWVPARQPPTDP